MPYTLSTTAHFLLFALMKRNNGVIKRAGTLIIKWVFYNVSIFLPPNLLEWERLDKFSRKTMEGFNKLKSIDAENKQNIRDRLELLLNEWQLTYLKLLMSLGIGIVIFLSSLLLALEIFYTPLLNFII